MTTRTKSYLIVVIVFVVGVIVGIFIGINRPNHITFAVRANGEVSLRPYPRDVIHWVYEDPGTHAGNPLPAANVNFYEQSAAGIPCEETPPPLHSHGTYSIPQCTVTTMPLYYYYDCKNPANQRSCQDPGVGPGSSTGPHTNLMNTLEDVFHPTGSGTRSPGRSLPASQSTDGVIQCDLDNPNQPKVKDIDYKVGSGIAIEWTSSVQGYSFDLSKAQPSGLACTGSNETTTFSSDLPYATCTLPNTTVANSYSYTVTVTDPTCPGTATGTINVH